MNGHELLAVRSRINQSIFETLFDNYHPTERGHASVNEFPNGPVAKGCQRPCFSGLLRKQAATCEVFEEYIRLQQHDDQTASGRVAVGWVLDKGSDLDHNLEVVVAMGINYGQGSKYLVAPVLNPDDTRMRNRLREAYKAVRANPSICRLGPIPQKGFHLIVGNFFPWITALPWSDYGFNAIEEAMFIHCCGLSDPHFHLRNLLESLGDAATHLVFHGANNAAPLLGTTFLSQHMEALNTLRQADIQTVFCDNLARPNFPVWNAVGLCFQKTGDEP